MPEIFHEAVEAYLARLAVAGPQLPEVFADMHAEASRRNFPIVGPEVGRFFMQLAAIRRPGRVLELGSGFGYSAICWALGAPGAEVHLTEYKQSNLDLAAEYAERAGVAKQLVMNPGDAFRSAAGIEGTFDLIFVDIDKSDYPRAIDLAEERLPAGGILIFDNMLWHGAVGRPETEWDRDTEAVVETAQRLWGSDRWLCSLLPIRDGAAMALRR